MLDIQDGATFNAHKINSGEYPTPEVLNRPAVGMINNDLILDQAIKMVARSGGSYLVTDQTKFLVHFNDTTKDVIGNVAVEAEEQGIKVIGLTQDNIFEGSYFCQEAATNLVSNNAGISSDLTSLSGWTVSSTNNKAASVTIISTTDGTVLDNTALLESQPIGGSGFAPGSITFASEKYVVSGATTSASLRIECDDNLIYRDMSIVLNIHFYTAANALLSTSSSTLATNTFNGFLIVEDITTPSLATQASADIVINYNSLQTSSYPSVACVTIKNFMHNSGAVKNYVSGVGVAQWLQYKNIVNGSSDFSVFSWVKFTDSQIDSYPRNFGPIFLKASTDSGIASFGMRHLATNAGVLTFCLSETDANLGTSFTISQSDIGIYRPCMIRKRIVNAAASLELLMLGYDGSLYKSALVPTTYTATLLDLILGKDPNESALSYFNGGISELRYDSEWLNDAQFTMLALNTRPFKVGNESSVSQWLSPTPNLIKNPEGKLGVNHWKDAPVELLSVIEDSEIGSGFSWANGSPTTVDIASSPILVGERIPVVFSGRIKVAAGSTGTLGIKISFYSDTAGVTYLSYSGVAASIGGEEQNYVVKATTPSGTNSMRAVLWVADATSSKTTWTKLKLEKSTYATMFTDDYTPAYAVYAE